MRIEFRSGLLLPFIALLSCQGVTQSSVDYVPLERVAVMPDKLNESSGLARGEKGTLFTHNDSANKSKLYKISGTTGEILETYELSVKQRDWEELAEDDDYLYLGDFGNNNGKRDDLRILKIPLNDLDPDEELEPVKIKFNYEGRPEEKEKGGHDYDCEAMIALGDSLYLFSKNRKTQTTDIYVLPKQSGDYTAVKKGNFDVGGLITAADYLPEERRLILLGYETKGGRYKSFLWLFDDFEGTDFFGGKAQRLEVAPNLQAEAVIWETPTTVLITNEEEIRGRGQLSRLTLPAAN